MKASLFYLPTIGSRAEIEAGMAGMRGDSISACSPTGKLPSAEEIVAQNYAYVGSPDTALRAIEASHNRQPVDWTFCYTYNNLVPHRVLMKSIETFWTKVMPRFV